MKTTRSAFCDLAYALLEYDLSTVYRHTLRTCTLPREGQSGSYRTYFHMRCVSRASQRNANGSTRILLVFSIDYSFRLSGQFVTFAIQKSQSHSASPLDWHTHERSQSENHVWWGVRYTRQSTPMSTPTSTPHDAQAHKYGDLAHHRHPLAAHITPLLCDTEFTHAL